MTDQAYAPLPPMPPAPAKKNWFARHKVLTGVGAFVAIVAVAGAAGSGGGSGTTTVDSAAGAKTTTTGNSSGAKSDAKSDAKAGETVEGVQADGKTWIYGDWKISNVKVANTPSINWFKITSDVTYLGEDTSGGDKCFNIALDKGSRQVTSGLGCASSVQPGKTATLDFSSMDDYVAGPYEITISKTW